MDGAPLDSETLFSEVANRLALAEATLLGLAYLTDPAFLGGVYERYRGRTYEGDLSFECMFNLVSDALMTRGGSLLAAVTAAQKDPAFDVSEQAVYGKLRRIPQSLSHGFLVEGATRLMDVMNPPVSPIPISLQDFEVLVIDGKKLKNVAKRLKPARSFRGSVLGGKVLAGIDLRTGLMRFMSSHQDGETNDVPLVAPLLEQMRCFPSEKTRLNVLDSQFCDLGLPQLFEDEGHHYVIRWSMKTSFERDELLDVKTGVNKQGLKYLDEWGWMGSKKDKRRRYVRRITLLRPGQESVMIFTSLLSEATYPAADLLQVYLQRWSIENVFQQLTEVFHLQHLISSTPCGTIFQFAFCSILYNQLILQRSYIVNSDSSPSVETAISGQITAEKSSTSTEVPSVTKPKKERFARKSADSAPPAITVENFSLEKYFTDVTDELIAWNKIIPRTWTINALATPLSAAELRKRLHQLLHGRWDSNWLKAKKKKFRPKEVDPPQPGGHTSVFRLIHGDPRTKHV
jgi:hypothetical protein